MLGRFVRANRRLSQRFARFANPRVGRKDGARAFGEIVDGYLASGLRVLDVGGGKQPAIGLDRKRELRLHVTGLDISADQLARAPAGCYDETLVADVVSAALPGKYDLILSRSVLEHLVEPDAALRNMAGSLDRGGVMLHLLPCRYALFATINRILGHEWGQRLLYSIFADSRRAQGFPAFYNDCHPRAMARIGASLQLDLELLQPYYCSDYASFFVPFYLLDYLRQVTLQHLGMTSLCENFVVALADPARRLVPAETAAPRAEHG